MKTAQASSQCTALWVDIRQQKMDGNRDEEEEDKKERDQEQ